MAIPIIGQDKSPALFSRKCGIIVQCREKSTRFPDKWKQEIDGIIMLEHVLLRCKQIWGQCSRFFPPSSVTFPLYVVIPETDIELERWLLDHQYKVYKGSENDVLSRYYGCANEYNLYWVVRITADCPMLDIVLASSMINVALMSKIDYISNTITRTYPDGYDVEIMTFQALQWLNDNVRGEDREHVTSYLLKSDNQREFMKKYKLAQFTGNIDLSHIKISIDTPAEMEYVKQEHNRIKLLKELTTKLGALTQ